MITARIKALFTFIDFLHSNINKFKKYDNDLLWHDSVVTEMSSLDKTHYQDLLKHKELKTKRKEIFKPIQENVIDVIKAKSIELELATEEKKTNHFHFLYNKNTAEILDLILNLDSPDAETIIDHKEKYIKFRTNFKFTNDLPFFFNELDSSLKTLFSMFFAKGVDEFESFKENQQETTPKRTSLHKPIDKNNRSLKIILDAFKKLGRENNKGWQYAFTYHEDFDLFTNLLVRFFEGEEIELPKKPIMTIKGSKTEVAKTLNFIHGRLNTKTTKLIKDHDYFNLARVLSELKDLDNTHLYKSMKH